MDTLTPEKRSERLDSAKRLVSCGRTAMTDVIEVAKERQARLAAEFGRLDDFIRMAEALVKNSQSKSSKASDTEDEKAAGGNGAEAEREDLSAR